MIETVGGRMKWMTRQHRAIQSGWTLKTLCSCFTPVVPQESPRECFTLQEGTCYMPPQLTSMYLTTNRVTSTGVRLMWDGLPDIPMLCMDHWQTELPVSFSKEPPSTPGLTGIGQS
uniref:Uncharacterized protein n=1 Tax=Cacopsylla melanoneura TaxID=428564 RepID=A0A8D9BMF3_9HEMI